MNAAQASHVGSAICRIVQMTGCSFGAARAAMVGVYARSASSAARTQHLSFAPFVVMRRASLAAFMKATSGVAAAMGQCN